LLFSVDMPLFWLSSMFGWFFQQAVRVIWHKAASLLQTDGSVVFARLRQCALPWRHIGTTWQIRLNLCFLRPTWVHNPNGKLIGSAIFVPSRRGCGPHLIHGFLGPPQSSTQMASRSVEQFFCRAHYCDWQTDLQTDRQTDRHHAARSVTIGCIYVHSTGCGLIIIFLNWIQFILFVSAPFWSSRY